MIKIFEIETSDGLKKLEIEIADGFLKRLLGLMGRKKIPQGRGLLLLPCNSVHMLFMRFPIDVVYVDENFVIKKIVKNLPTWTGISICFGAKAALEFSAGEVERLNFEIGNSIVRTDLKTSESEGEQNQNSYL